MADSWRASVVDRIARHARLCQSGCVEWVGARTRDGYGKIWLKGRCLLAHRASYASWRGPITDGLTLDHLCRNRACVNPYHLEEVTVGENTRRGNTVSAVNAAKTHCKHGHEFTPDNTYIYCGSRCCRACNRACQAAKRVRP